MERCARSLLTVISVVLALGPGASAQGTVTLRWTTCSAQIDRHELFQRWAARFEARHPYIDIEWSAPSPYGETIAVQTAAGAGPDVAWLGADYWRFYELLLPLEELRKAGGPLADTFPASFTFFSWQGVLGAAPYGMNTVVMFANLDRLAEVGLGLPDADWTWADLIDMSAKLTQAAGADGAAQRLGVELRYGGTTQMTATFGGPAYTPDGRRSTLNHPVSVAATQQVADILSGNLGIHPQGNALGDWRAQFQTGTTALVAAGVWAPPFMRQNITFDWDVVPFPSFEYGGEVYRQTFVSGEAWAIFRTTEHPQEAMRFLRFLLEPEQTREMAALGGIIPAQAEVARTTFFTSDLRPAHIRAFVESLEFSKPLYRYHPAGNQVHQAIWPTLSAIFAGTTPAESGFEEMERLANEQLAAFWADREG